MQRLQCHNSVRYQSQLCWPSVAVILVIVAMCWSATYAYPVSASERVLESTSDEVPRNPMIPGDHPDPSIIRIGKTYWTTSTAGGWAPEFALYRSTDLTHWVPVAAVFPHTPSWARGDFWAPELVYDRGKVLVYYVARKVGGPLCVAAATADKPEGPYQDHGPIVCQSDGSIDPAFVRDEKGQPYLIWKEDGNSQRKLTPIWAQPLTADLVHLTGEPTQLIVNEPASWEGGVVEGPYIMRHGGHFYMFYAGNACCGVKCNYAEGVARADHLLGPWQKDPANPVIMPNGTWKCPGHGTAVQTPRGDDYLVYHAYPVSGTVFLGRESVIDRIVWNSSGWPLINNGNGPTETTSQAASTVSELHDDFSQATLSPEWRWPLGHEPSLETGHGFLAINTPQQGESFVARSPTSAVYTSSVRLLPGEASGGLGIIGNAENQCALVRQTDHLELVRIKSGNKEVVWHSPSDTTGALWFRAHVAIGDEAEFSFSHDGRQWMNAGSSISLSGLPPWDQGLRVGLIAMSGTAGKVQLSNFSLKAN